MKAQYNTVCPECQSWIYQGEEITQRDGEWCCASCGNEPGGFSEPRVARSRLEPELAEPIKAGEVMCERCLTYHPGEC